MTRLSREYRTARIPGHAVQTIATVRTLAVAIERYGHIIVARHRARIVAACNPQTH